MKFWNLLSKPLKQVLREIRLVTLSKYEVDDWSPTVFLRLYKKGVALTAEDGKTVTKIEFVGVNPWSDYRPYQGEAVPGLPLSLARSKVLAVLGVPEFERQGAGTYDTYLWQGYIMLITYLEDDSQIESLVLLDKSHSLAQRVMAGFANSKKLGA